MTFYLHKIRSRSRSTIFAMTQFDGKHQPIYIYIYIYIYLFIYLYVVFRLFCASSYLIRDFYFRKVHQGHRVRFLQLPVDDKYKKTYKSRLTQFRGNKPFQDVNVSHLWPARNRRKYGVQFSQWYQNLQIYFIHFWFSLRYDLRERK